MAPIHPLRYSFQPGPSQLAPDVLSLIEEAVQQRLLSRYHRDPVWRELFSQAQESVRSHLELPGEWLVVFVSSATEAWQVLVDATADLTSIHILQGAFGERWYHLQKAVSPFAYSYAVQEGSQWEPQLSSLAEKYGAIGFVGVVHTETSRGAELPALSDLRSSFPQALIAVDVTSSLGGLLLPWEAADIWFASVQKCLGLPPGFGVLLLSPSAWKRFADLPRTRYNSLGYLIEKARQHEPPFTPNLLSLYLLARSLPSRPTLRNTADQLEKRARWLYDALEKAGYQPKVNKPYRARTVLSFRWREGQNVAQIRGKLEAAGLYLGWGYGEEKEASFRIANFPALPQEAYEELVEQLKEA
ncbi:MAG: aminotransferase class V-fold PLP-dependent enzyme [Bacteroidia bacterium]|nr:aminotransferase class V-fold PLP-dependent enzyme [Bacteroidia bacterium]